MKYKMFFEPGEALYLEGFYQLRWDGSDYQFNIKEVRLLESVGEALTHSVTLKLLVENVTPEIIQQEWGNWHLEYQSQYPNLDWKTTIHDIRNMVNKIIYITEDQLSSIEGNVLLAYGDNDIYTMEHIIYLRKTIRDSELMILPGTNHSTFDEQPEIMSLAIKDFFDK